MDLRSKLAGLSTSTTEDSNRNRTDLDQAYWFIEKSRDAAEESLSVDLDNVHRKVDWRIVPVMLLCYTVQFIDKTLLNYAAVMGLNPDLKLRGNDFSNTVSAFQIAFLIAEIPNGYFLQMISARRWLAGNVLVWGIVTACTAATHNYHSLLTARIFLGIFEASIAPTQIVITSQWYTKSEQAPRASLWYCGLGAGQIIGAFLSWAFQQAEHSAFASWRIMFVALGIITIVTAIVTYLVLPDTPMTASFLSPAEKLALLKHVSVNQTGIENRHFKLSQVLEILQDVQLWLMVVLAILSALPTGVVSVYSATILRNAGFKPDIAALLLMPQGVASIIAAVVVGYGVLRTSHRWAWIVLCCMMGILGGALLSFMPKSNHAGLLAGIYLTSSITPTLLLLYQWTASNVAGLTKRSVSLALVAGSFSAGSIIAPQTFQARDAPQYLPAKITSLASQVAGALLAFLLFCYYVWANKRKDKRSASLEGQNIQGNEQDLWENMTDKENQTFRYVY